MGWLCCHAEVAVRLVLVEGPHVWVGAGRTPPLLLPPAPGCPGQQQLASCYCCCCCLHQVALLLLLLFLRVQRYEAQLLELLWTDQVLALLLLLPGADPQSQAVCHHSQQAVHLMRDITINGHMDNTITHNEQCTTTV
jgi:hypothetical protein